MGHKIKTIYVIHHSHTDIGFTELQENIIENQKNYIRKAVNITENPETSDFRWNCETLFCVEKFLEDSTTDERERFFNLARDGKIGLSANYLNFTDLVDCEVLSKRLSDFQKFFQSKNIKMDSAMFADINGISMGHRDALIDNNIEFLYTNMHTHHGMYPLYKNHTPYYWENKDGKRLLVWNGEHYHLGNTLFLYSPEIVDELWKYIDKYIGELEDEGYVYDFLVTSVSGVFEDNAPPRGEIYKAIEKFNELHSDKVQIEMLTLSDLYRVLKEKLTEIPVYSGDLTDWWANGIASTPQIVKHYREAQNKYKKALRIDSKLPEKYPDLIRQVDDNLLLYAEHTWGHFLSVVNPYADIVNNLDIRKNSYASKAHEAASTLLKKVFIANDEELRYYNMTGEIKVINPNAVTEPQIVEIYLKNTEIATLNITDNKGNLIKNTVTPYNNGRLVTLIDSFEPFEEKVYTFCGFDEKIGKSFHQPNHRGIDDVCDIVCEHNKNINIANEFENKFFKLSYKIHSGITSFVDKRNDRELLGKSIAPLFTPIYQVTQLTDEPSKLDSERRQLGRNSKSKDAKSFIGILNNVELVQSNDIYTTIRLKFSLPETTRSNVIIRFYEDIPRIDFTLEIGKSLSHNLENIFLPLSLNIPESELSTVKGGTEVFRPGIDQIPGTCMDFYVFDDGFIYTSPDGSAMISTPDTPLIYMGDIAHHPIKLCDNDKKNNDRPVYSWVMNNYWEANFKSDLSGYYSFNYSLCLDKENNKEKAVNQLHERSFAPVAFTL